MSIPQCQGGWGCSKREKCAHYHAPEIPGRAPTDRLCEPGQHDAFQPIATGIKRMPDRAAAIDFARRSA